MKLSGIATEMFFVSACSKINIMGQLFSYILCYI